MGKENLKQTTKTFFKIISIRVKEVTNRKLRKICIQNTRGSKPLKPVEKGRGCLASKISCMAPQVKILTLR